MKKKSIQLIVMSIIICFLLFNIVLLFLLQQYKNELHNAEKSLIHLENIKFKFELSKETTVNRFKYEQRRIDNPYIYLGSDHKTLISIHSIIDQPKLVIGLNHIMCSPCVEKVL